MFYLSLVTFSLISALVSCVFLTISCALNSLRNNVKLLLIYMGSTDIDLCVMTIKPVKFIQLPSICDHEQREE